MPKKKRTLKTKPFVRSIQVEQDKIDAENRTVEFSFSSEYPVLRYDWDLGRYYEILDHSAGAVDLTRLKEGGPIMHNHYSDQIGVTEDAWIGDDKRCYVKARYSKNQRADEIFQDIVDGIRKNVSVGYRALEMRLEKQEGKIKYYRVTKWEPYEVSNVTVPADPTVGVSRSLDNQPENDIEIIEEETQSNSNKERNMPGATTTEPKPNMTVNEPAPNLDQVRGDAIKMERERISAIRLMGEKLNLNERATEAVDKGLSVDAFRKIVVEEFQTRNNANAVNNPKGAEIGLSRKEKQEYSFQRAILAAANNDWSKAGFERECSEAVQKQRNKAPEGFFIPFDVLSERSELPAGMATRAQTVGSAEAGGNLVATNLLSGSFIDMLRNSNILAALGVNYLPGLVGNLTIPKQTGGASIFHVSEGEAVGETGFTIGQVALSPKTLGAYTQLSRRFLLQSSIAAEPFTRRELATALGLGIQQDVFMGTGADGQPRGILNTSGIGAVIGGTNGAAPTWDHVVKLEEVVDVLNALAGTLKYVTNSKVRSKLKRTQKFANTNGDPVWEKGNVLNGYEALVTNAIPSNGDKGTSVGVCSTTLFGDFSSVYVGLWSGMDVIVNPYANDKKGAVDITIHQDIDVALRHAESFAAMVDMLTN